MDCTAFEELMSAALDGQCTADERRALDSHLAVCPQCRELFGVLSAQSAALRKLDCRIPEQLKSDIMANLPRQEHKILPWKRWTTGVAAACLVLVVGLLVAPRLDQKNAFQAFSAEVAPAASVAPQAPMPYDAAPMENSVSLMDSAKFGAQEECTQPENGWCGDSLHIQLSDECTGAEPSARVLHSREELEGFLAELTGDLSQPVEALAEQYPRDYFEAGMGLLVITAEDSAAELEISALTHEDVVLVKTSDELHNPVSHLLVAEVDETFACTDTLSVRMEITEVN